MTAVDTCSGDNVEDVHIVDSTKVLASKMRKQLRLATWNVQAERELLVASWEKEDSTMLMDISLKLC